MIEKSRGLIREKSPRLLERVATRNYPTRTTNLKLFCHFTFSQTFDKCQANKQLEQIGYLK